MSVTLSDAEFAEASKCRRTVSVCTPSKRCKAGMVRLLPLKLTPITGGYSPNPILFLHEWQQTGLFDSGQGCEECNLYDAGMPADFDPARKRSTVHNLGDGQCH